MRPTCQGRASAARSACSSRVWVKEKPAPVSFADDDCAFDIQARLADGKTATFTGVNLCDVATVTLNRGPTGALWVDYD